MFDTLIDWAGSLFTDSYDAIASFFTEDAPQTFAAGDAIDAGTDTPMPDGLTAPDLPVENVTDQAPIESAPPADLLPGELKSEVKRQLETGGVNGFKSWFSALPQDQQAILMRAGMNAAASGAGGLLAGVAQKNKQEFQAEQSEKDREFERAKEERARQERLNNRSVVARSVTVKPRGIIAGATGG